MSVLMPIMLSACALAAAAAGMLVWSFRHGIQRRIDRDVAWLDEVRLRFRPDVSDSRKYVHLFYLVQCVVVLPLLNFLIPIPLVGIALWMSLWLLPQQIADLKWARRMRIIEEQLPQTIRQFASLCGAGLSPADALRQLTNEVPMPIRYEYRIMANEWELGANLVTITESAAKRLQLESVRLFSAVVSANNRLGGNLVKTLEDLGRALEGQLEMHREIDSALSEGRMNIYGLMLAPPLMMGLVCIMDSQAVIEFFHTKAGWGIFLVAMSLILSGWAWARRIANIQV